MWVQEPDRWDHLDPLIIFEQVNTQGGQALLDELIETRRVLETEIASMAAARRTEEDLAALRDALVGMERSKDDARAYTQYDIVFHDAILAAARNRLLREALRPVGVISRSLPSHHAIYDAIASSDAAQAREAMRRHITQFEEDIRAGLREGALQE
jgi:DNA-binding FadR family transcriptional regulator